MHKDLTPATARGEATRARLLAAAQAEFGSKGFHAASVSSITACANVGQGTFYLYFRSKEEIFTTLVHDIGAQLRTRLALIVGGIEDDRAEAERRSLECLLHFVRSCSSQHRIVLESQFVDQPAFREFHEEVAALLTAALHAAGLSSYAAEVRAWSLLGIGQLLGMRYCSADGDLPSPAALDVATAPPPDEVVEQLH